MRVALCSGTGKLARINKPLELQGLISFKDTEMAHLIFTLQAQSLRTPILTGMQVTFTDDTYPPVCAY